MKRGHRHRWLKSIRHVVGDYDDAGRMMLAQEHYGLRCAVKACRKFVPFRTPKPWPSVEELAVRRNATKKNYKKTPAYIET